MTSATPVFLLPGWGQHSAAWQAVCASLSGVAVHYAELPGHAGTAWHEGDFALDGLVDRYAAAAPASCAVLAWSLGAQIALRWAQRYPHQLCKLVLVAATPCFGMRPDWSAGASAEVQQAFATQVEADPARALQRFADLLAEGEADVRGVRRALRALLGAQPLPPKAALLAGLQALAENDLRAVLCAQPPAQPCLLLHGMGDTITPVAASEWLCQTLPQVRLLSLPQCGHAPMVSHVTATAHAIQMFLNE